MAAVAPAGARDALSYPDSPESESPSIATNGALVGKSPRCEAFVMTGDKMLHLTSNISPSYAKVARDQLPPTAQIQESPKRPPHFGEFPSVRRSLHGRSKLPVAVAAQQSDPAMRQKLFASDDSKDSAIAVENGDKHSTPSVEVVLSQNEADVQAAVETIERAMTLPEEERPTVSTLEAETVMPPQGMESSMHSSYYKSAFSNPQLSARRDSSETFVISPNGSPVKNSTITVNALNCQPSSTTAVSTTSPSLRRILAAQRNNESRQNSMSRFGSFRSEATDHSQPDEERDAARIAAKFYFLRGVSKADVAERLNDQSEFSALITVKYLELFTFAGIRIDAALRDFLSKVELRGETSQRERLLRFFSCRYHNSNPSIFSSVDEVHALTCSLLLLNSDLHGPNCGKRMHVRDFINNLSHTGCEYKRDLLKTLYCSIKDNAIVHETDTPVLNPTRRSVTCESMRLLEVDPESQVEYKSGWLVRKCVYDADGARTPMGRRGWKMMFARLRGLALYLSADEHSGKRSRYEVFSNAILLHHAFAEPIGDYKKKQHVFRIQTADLGEFLLQTSSSAEVADWVMQINFVCAAFSSRALPPAASSTLRFCRPRMPKMPSSAPLLRQLKDHESAAQELHVQLTQVQNAAPPLKARGKAVEEFFFRERFLTHEIGRYEAYCTLLRSRIGMEMMSDSTSGVHSKSDVADDFDRMSYKEAVQR